MLQVLLCRVIDKKDLNDDARNPDLEILNFPENWNSIIIFSRLSTNSFNYEKRVNIVSTVAQFYSFVSFMSI